MVPVGTAWSDVEKEADALQLLRQWRESRDTSQTVEKPTDRNLSTQWKQQIKNIGLKLGKPSTYSSKKTGP
jgi:hypothetical protein